MVPMLHPNGPSASFRGGTMIPAAILMELANIWTMAKITMINQL